MRFQDEGRILNDLAVFHDGERVADADPDPRHSDDLRVDLDARYPDGWEVLAVCPDHPNASALDCLDCFPMED